ASVIEVPGVRIEDETRAIEEWWIVTVVVRWIIAAIIDGWRCPWLGTPFGQSRLLVVLLPDRLKGLVRRPEREGDRCFEPEGELVFGINDRGLAARDEDADGRGGSSSYRSYAGTQSTFGRSPDRRADTAAGPNGTDVPAYRGVAPPLLQGRFHLDLPAINQAKLGEFQTEP